MKYMTFNSSCSYAGLANLLDFYGIDTEDREIALQMRLPYLFACQDGGYLAGPMLQGAAWFDLYLNPLGFKLEERILGKDEVCAELRDNAPAMLGLRVSPEGKHAVIYTGCNGGKYRFLNNKRKGPPEMETLELSEKDLLASLDEETVVGRLERTDPVPIDYRPYLEQSVLVFRELQEKIAAYCGVEQSAPSLRQAMDSLFRPVLLDGVTMLELLGETEIAGALKEIRAQFLRVIRAERPAVLERALDMPRLQAALHQYEELILRRMEAE